MILIDVKYEQLSYELEKATLTEEEGGKNKTSRKQIELIHN